MTTNEMIYKTINTKLTKEPMYKSVLEDLGYEVYDSDWSAYNNWTVKNKATGRTVVISKNCDNKKGLFDGGSAIEYTDIKKVNYTAYLGKNKKANGMPYFMQPISKYRELRDIIKGSKTCIRWDKRHIFSIKKEIEKLNEQLDRYNEQISKYQKKLDDARKRVIELKGE